MGQDKAVQSLFVTLRRSPIGKPFFHRKVLTSLGLNKRLLCVEKPNNPAIRGMLRKVAHLVTIETDHVYYNRKLAEYEASKLRPPVTVRHNLTGGFAAAPVMTSSSSSSTRSSQECSQQHL
eukprot:GHUV01010687.1.p2 GENE.GHUV01010687.1~~GHUV01010687.1.p2  ORF type:complete len:121 (+),score=35.98 GHUV01010687.1:369-731(+)